MAGEAAKGQEEGQKGKQRHGWGSGTGTGESHGKLPQTSGQLHGSKKRDGVGRVRMKLKCDFRGE